MGEDQKQTDADIQAIIVGFFDTYRDSKATAKEIETLTLGGEVSIDASGLTSQIDRLMMLEGKP